MKTIGLITAVIGALALTLAGCGLTPNREADEAAKALFTQIRTGADISQDQRFGEDLRRADPAALQRIRAIIGSGEPMRVDNRGFSFNTNQNGGIAELTHAYIFADRTIIARTNLRRPPGAPRWLVVGIDVNRQGGGAASTTGGPATATDTSDSVLEETQAATRRIYTQLRDGADFTQDQTVGPEMRSPDSLPAIRQMRAMIPPQEAPRSIVNRNYRSQSNAEGLIAERMDVYTYSDRTITQRTILVRPRGSTDWRVDGVNLRSRGLNESSGSQDGGAENQPAPAEEAEPAE